MRSLPHIISGIFLLVLVACETAQPTTQTTPDAEPDVVTPMRMFNPPSASIAVRRSNADIAQEFLDLSFMLESGQRLTTMTRFEGPITIKFNTPVPAYAERDMNQLVQRLRNEARIDISRVAMDQPANIVVETVPGSQMARIAPTAACFVVPNATSWADFRKNRRNFQTDWAVLIRRTRVAIFLPQNVPPQEFRDCLHEEIGQALGPLNDLYRLRDSVFNDDNFNLILQPFDMLVLRAYYSPILRNGMTRQQVASRIPAILAGLNPAGRSVPSDARPRTSREWAHQIGTALGRNASGRKRVKAATRAIEIADTENYSDHRIGFSFLARARVSMQSNPEQAARDFAAAYSIFQSLFGPDDIHTAQGSVQMATLALSAGAYDDAQVLIDAAIPPARRAQDAIMLFTLLGLKAEVFRQTGRAAEAQKLVVEARSWGKYGLLSDQLLSRRLKQIALLPPPARTPES